MDWMGEIPVWMHSYPLSTIAIPGSHDSGSFSLDPSGPFAPDQARTLAAILATFGCIARPIVFRWSVTQELSFTQQLEAGIRYFDLRISKGPTEGEFSIVHGLFGCTVNACLGEINRYSIKHPSEVMIVDINHFYDMPLLSDHKELINIIVQNLGPKLVPAQENFERVSLQSLWGTPRRVICFYHSCISQQFPKYLWSSASVICPWANVTEADELINYLDQRYSCGPCPPRLMYGTQGVLTPRVSTVLRYATSSLKDAMALGATKAFLNWIKSKEENNWFNVIIADFMQTNNFAQEVIRLNFLKKAPGFRVIRQASIRPADCDTGEYGDADCPKHS